MQRRGKHSESMVVRENAIFFFFFLVKDLESNGILIIVTVPGTEFVQGELCK